MAMKMDPRKLMILSILALEFSWRAYGNLVFPVQHKYKGREKTPREMRAHDARRRGRFLSAVDVDLGGRGHPAETGLYYTKLGLGSPPKDFYVQVDTGSDLLWVNCIECTKCPTKSDIGMDLSLYDPKGSNTSDVVSCDEDFCLSSFDNSIAKCKPGTACRYSVTYGDGSETVGYFVKDYLTFQQVNGDRATALANSTVNFGCGGQQSGLLGSSEEALDGIFGFGQANSSVLSQLAASGKVKKVFSHCLDNIRGGGIFAIGELVEPKFNTTPLLPKQAHYNVVLKDIEVNGDLLEVPIDIFDIDNGMETIVDSGTTLAYLPASVHDQLMSKILSGQHGLEFSIVDDQFNCFAYTGNVDDGFPIVKFHFENSVTLTVYPHDYLFQIRDLRWCIGWQKSVSQTRSGKELTLLGDIVLSNKLVLYDLENMAVGWTEYNCSSSIRVKDETTGKVYTVGAHQLSSASTLLIGRIFTFFLLLVAMLNSLYE